MKRRFLFLQGPATPFFSRLAEMLCSEGHEVLKIHFNVGDLVYWFGGDSVAYRGSLEEFRSFLDRIYRDRGVTDQILFGDRRPIHRLAVAHGANCNVRTWVFEEGYFRPHWVTLEREGVNAHSLLPRDPDWFRDAVCRIQSIPKPVVFRSPFWVRAAHDVAYHASGLVNFALFPRYRTHAPILAPLEYAGYIKRLSMLRVIRKREYGRVQELCESGRSYYVLPLQLNSDAQIRDHSRFENMTAAIDYVLASFAQNAPADTLLAIKNHPLDMGLSNFAQAIRKNESRYGLFGRVQYFEDGNLLSLIRNAKGLVTVNSTVGMIALELGVPTLTLSDPIYNLPGLTFQGGIDGFWSAVVPPEETLFQAFHQVVVQATQVNGGFYCRQGIALASQNASRTLNSDVSPLEALL